MSQLLFFLPHMTGVFSPTRSDLRQHIWEVKVQDSPFSKYYLTVKKEDTLFIWNQAIPFDSFFMFSNFLNFTIFTTTCADPARQHVFFSHFYYYWFCLFLKINTSNIYFLQDLYIFKKVKSEHICLLNVACYYTSSMLTLYTEVKKNLTIESLSGIYRGFIWVEREVQEFSNLLFCNLLDTRRLLTDYTQNTDVNLSYKTTHYDILTQNLYYIQVLHWLYLFSYLIICILFSFVIANKHMLSVLLLGEVLIILLFSISLLLTSIYNIYYLFAVSLIFLVLGGLELSLNLLLIIV